MKRKLTQRLLLNYFLIVLLPACFLFFLAFGWIANRSIAGETLKLQSALDINTQEVMNRLQTVEAVGASAMESGSLSGFLEYNYRADWEAIYDYMRYIKPEIQWILSGSSDVENIRFYTDSVKLNPGGFFSSLDQLPVRLMRPMEFCWVVQPDQTLKCYRGSLGKTNRTLKHVVEITVSASLLENYELLLSVENSNTSYCIMDSEGKVLNGSDWVKKATDEAEWRYCSATAEIRPLGLFVIQAIDRWSMMRRAATYLPWIILVLFICFLLLLIVNLSSVYGMARRIVGLTDHIRCLGEGEYKPYFSGENYQGDEIDDLVITFNQMARRTDILVNQVQKAEILRRRAEYEAYQSRIEPHFLYGTLENLRMLAIRNRDEETAGGILNLAGIMRYALAPNAKSTLRRELQQVERYLNLQKLRLGSRMEWVCDIAPEVALEEECPPFLLQPIVENSIRHGLEEKREGGKIVIQVWRDYISVYDNGAGIRPERLKEIRNMLENGRKINTEMEGNNGYALLNVSMRVRLFYGPDAKLMVESEFGKGTNVRLELREVGLQ